MIQFSGKKLTLLSLLLVGCVTLSAGQMGDITWGEKILAKGKAYEVKLLDEQNGRPVVARSIPAGFNSPAELWLEVYGDAMNPFIVQPVNFRHQDTAMNYRFSVRHGSKIYVVASLPRPRKKEQAIYARMYDVQSLQAVGDWRPLTVMPWSKKMTAPKARNLTQASREGNILHATSNGEEQMVLVYEYWRPGTHNEEFLVQVLDTGLTVDWQKKVVLDRPDQMFSLENVAVDQKGNVYFSGRDYPEFTGFQDGVQPNFTYRVWRLSERGAKETVLPVALEGGTVLSLKPHVQGNELWMTGFSAISGQGRESGAFVLRAPLALDGVTGKSLQPFSKAFTDQYLNPDQQLVEAEEIQQGKHTWNHVMSDLIPTGNGDFFLVAQGHRMELAEYPATSVDYRQSYHNSYLTNRYRHLTALRLNAEGSIVQHSRVAFNAVSPATGEPARLMAAWTRAGEKTHLIYPCNRSDVGRATDTWHEVKMNTLCRCSVSSDATPPTAELLPDSPRARSAQFLFLGQGGGSGNLYFFTKRGTTFQVGKSLKTKL